MKSTCIERHAYISQISELIVDELEMAVDMKYFPKSAMLYVFWYITASACLSFTSTT